MRRLLVVLAFALFAAPAFATDVPNGQENLFSAYIGKFDVFGAGTDKQSMAVGGEYWFQDEYHGLRPVAGGFGNSDGGLYGYAGAYWDLPLGSWPIIISPGFAVGAYHEGGSKNLGGLLEFRSTLEATYGFASGDRLGMALSHLSNANLGTTNPGVEVLQVVYSKALY